MEAAYLLAGPIKAGTWHLIGDGIVLDPVDVTFDLLWRDGNGDHPIATWTHHFDPGASVNEAVQYEEDAARPASPPTPRATTQRLRSERRGRRHARYDAVVPSTATASAANGRDPSLTLPK